MKTIVTVMAIGSLITLGATCLFAILERCIGIDNIFIICTCLVLFSALLALFYQIGQRIDRKRRRQGKREKGNYIKY